MWGGGVLTKGNGGGRGQKNEEGESNIPKRASDGKRRHP